MFGERQSKEEVNEWSDLTICIINITLLTSFKYLTNYGDLDLYSAVHFTMGVAQVPGTLLGVDVRQVESNGVVFKMHDN